MKNVFRLLTAAVWMVGLSGVSAAVRYVPGGGTPNYPTIQAAIDACQSGDSVRVQPGTYQESINFGILNITLTSMDPGDSNIVQTTIIEGDGTNSVVTFSGGQTTNTLFTGFTVRGGGGTVYSTYYLLGGGIYCFQSSPSIVRNIIEENHLPMDYTANLYSRGGAISCWNASPRIARNIIRNNSAYLGGALASESGSPVIEDNWIYANTAVAGGAAYLADQGISLNNTFWENTPDNLYIYTTGFVVNNIIANSTPAMGMTIWTFATIQLSDVLAWCKYNDIWSVGGTAILLYTNGGYEQANFTSIPGPDGNVSADPFFADAMNLNLRLSAASPCINAGDFVGWRSTNELDFEGNSRVFASRVDIGASEFKGIKDFAPFANAGPDQTIFWSSGMHVMLDGSGSFDPDGLPLSYTWVQAAGATVSLATSNAQAFFTPPGLGDYRFELVVNDGVNDSLPDTVRITVTNLPPIASAGLGQNLPVIPEVMTLDGSHSFDPDGMPLLLNWRQTSGPAVELSNSNSPRPSFRPSGPGAYKFELTVSDAFSTSPPAGVTFYLGQVPPVANAGPTRYSLRGAFQLDGTGSFAPNNTNALTYAWRQVSGRPAVLLLTNTPRVLLTGIVPTTNVQEMEFELVVSAGGLTSEPSIIKVFIIPALGNSRINLINPPFRTNLPTVIGFEGGDCVTGSSVNFSSSWFSRANFFTLSYSPDTNSPTGDPQYFGYGDQIIDYLSTAAPNYSQPIQTLGFSTGGMPACDTAERLNVFYKDPRYRVNRITLLDSACRSDYSEKIDYLNSNREPGAMFWVENYYSAAGTFRSGALNAQFPVPPADHGTPYNWYFLSWNLAAPYSEATFQNGVIAGLFFSVIGPGKNYQLNTENSEYYFGWNPPPPIPAFPLNGLVRMIPAVYPGQLPGVVELMGPTNGTLTSERTVGFSCKPTVNAVQYEILSGPDPGHVDHVVWRGQMPPGQQRLKLPFATTWWTIRVADAYGTTSWADPRYVIRDSDADGLSDEAEVRAYHTDPDNADTDGDGHYDGQEVLAGTDPFQPDLGLQLFCRLVSTNLQFSWFSRSSNSYDLEVSTELSSWQPLQTSVAPPGGGLIQHSIPMPDAPAEFYRLRSYATPGD